MRLWTVWKRRVDEELFASNILIAETGNIFENEIFIINPKLTLGTLGTPTVANTYDSDPRYTDPPCCFWLGGGCEGQGSTFQSA